ncbi:MAG TPA: hypothetical protein VJN89_21985 [Candidatus Acidoferrum sp.]|nr:hypothetical protein [Candidatus Acidoferrum sp.]
MRETSDWLHEKCSDLLPKTRNGFVESSPTLFCLFHPAAEEVELSLIDPEHLVASANTSTVGPGYHIYLCDLLKQWANDFHASWQQSDEESSDYWDETEYFFTGDQQRVFDNMTNWLEALANTFFEKPIKLNDYGNALCMPMDVQFESQQMAITPLGPRDREWLYQTSQDGIKGKDFFAWWDPSLDSEYFLGRALALMWSNVRWRRPANDQERRLLKEVDNSLRIAYGLNPSLKYPWTEWREILKNLDTDLEATELFRSHAVGNPTVGYRRRRVWVTLPGRWRMHIPGSFSEFESDQEHNLFALDPPREIWFTSYRFTVPHDHSFESSKEKFLAEPAEYIYESVDYVARATIRKKTRESGEDYFVLSSSNMCRTQRAVCTILFSQGDQKEWALETWRSIQSPSLPVSPSGSET